MLALPAIGHLRQSISPGRLGNQSTKNKTKNTTTTSSIFFFSSPPSRKLASCSISSPPFSFPSHTSSIANFSSFSSIATPLWRRRNHRSSPSSSTSIPCKASSTPPPSPEDDDQPSSSSSSSPSLVELPLFPLPLVLFPGAILPLQIFEFRYRIMMHTLLQTDLRFGVVFTDRSTGLAEIGCVGQVIKHERLVDDRFFLICKGQERFRVASVVRTSPYLVAEVEWVEDKPPAAPPQSAAEGGDQEAEGEDLEKLASEVEAYMKDVIRLSNRMNKKADKDAPENLRKNLFPAPFSFWVGSTFEGAPLEQQALLEMEDTAMRLRREKETLRNTLNYLTAASAVKDVFSSQSE